MNHITKLYLLSPTRAWVIFVILDVLCIGMGMGVPIFSIMLGFGVGWYLVKRITLGTRQIGVVLWRLLAYACVTASVTFLGMVLIWGWCITMLWGPPATVENFGLPLILYEPRASFIGWLLLMMVVSPFLQLLTTVFAGHLALLSVYRQKETATTQAIT